VHPAVDIIALPHTASWAEVVAAFAEHGHSRMPVYREVLDEVIGMMLIKDVFPFWPGKRNPPATGPA
jgi:CBS domain containing-hemolysin-like protein